MLLRKEDSALILIDVQENLTPLVLNHEELIKNCQWVLNLGRELDIPTIVTEQYPQGLGKTLSSLCNTKAIEKVAFSCASHEPFLQTLKNLHKKHVILIGIESHVCVMQTALQLKELNYEVFVVVEAISSRKEIDHRFALKRMKNAGIHLITKEMLFFEWLRVAGNDTFKKLSTSFLKS